MESCGAPIGFKPFRVAPEWEASCNSVDNMPRIEGIFVLKDFSKDKTWLIDPKTNKEIEVDEGLDIDHGEFVKIKESGIKQNLYCILKEVEGRKYFEVACLTNLNDITEIKNLLSASR